jgi:hypothetical protein
MQNGGGFGGPAGVEFLHLTSKFMQNGGGFGGPAGVEFLHLTSKFWSRGPYGGPTGDALTPLHPSGFPSSSPGWIVPVVCDPLA